MLSHNLLRIAGAAILAGSVGWTGAAMSQSLHDDLGGQDFIECWIDRSLNVISRDKRINDFFAGELNAGQELSLRDSLIEFACAATGGAIDGEECVYGGREMLCAHAGLGIGHRDFEAFINDLGKAAERCEPADPAAYEQLAKVLRSMRPEVVQDDPGEEEAAFESCDAM